MGLCILQTGGRQLAGRHGAAPQIVLHGLLKQEQVKKVNAAAAVATVVAQ